MDRRGGVRLLLCSVCLVWLVAGCSMKSGPNLHYPLDFQVVASNQPVLQWQKSLNTSATYDVIVFERLDAEDVQAYGGLNPDYASTMKEVYYSENIQGARYQLPALLKPNTTYYWAVRTRSGDKVSPWSTSEVAMPVDSGEYEAKKMFEFRTPERQ